MDLSEKKKLDETLNNFLSSVSNNLSEVTGAVLILLCCIFRSFESLDTPHSLNFTAQMVTISTYEGGRIIPLSLSLKPFQTDSFPAHAVFHISYHFSFCFVHSDCERFEKNFNPRRYYIISTILVFWRCLQNKQVKFL